MRVSLELVAAGAFLTAGFLGGSNGASAQSLFSPTPIAYNWTGFYIGGFAGGAWGDIEATELFTNDRGGVFYNIASGSPYGFDFESGLVGGHLGYDRQWNKLVVGVGGSIAYSDVGGSIADPNALPTGAPITAFDGRWQADLTGRAGMVFGRLLIYLRGGIALLDASGSTVDTCRRSFCGPNTIRATGDELLLGWTAGAGGEVAINHNWSAGIEYRYSDFEDLQVSGVSSDGPLYSQNIDLDQHSVRGFLSYRW